MRKLLRVTTIGLSLSVFCRGLLRRLSEREGFDVVALSSPDEELAATGQAEGVRTIGVKMERRIAPFADLRSLYRLVKVMRRERPDIVHTMTPKAGLLGMMAARIAGVPVRIHTFTGLVFPTSRGLKKALLKTTDRLTCACATHIIPEGEGVKADLISGGITRKPLRVLGYGNVRGFDPEYYRNSPEITEEAMRLRERFGIRPSEKVFVFIGRFVVDKGIRELLDAFRSLPPEAGWHLVMAGAPEEGVDGITESMMTGIERLHTSGGWVTDVRPWLAMADALVFPSYREGFPNVVIEAGAMELPSVVTDINGSREIVEDWVTGFIVPPRDSGALKEAMTRVASMSGAEREAMGKAARESVVARFDHRIVQQALIDYYNTVMS